MRVIDFHSHFFARPFFETLAKLSPLEGTVEDKLDALSRRTGIELPPVDVAPHLQRWLQELDAHDVEHLVTFASLPPEAPAVLEAVRLAEGRLSGMAVLDPTSDGAPARAAELLDAGFRGLLAFPAMHRYDPAGPEMEPVLHEADARKAVVYVHCGILVVKLRDLLGLPRPYDLKFADPLRLVPVANRFPATTFVVPHFGAGFLRETLMLGAQCENVCVDTSSSNSWTRTQPGLDGLGEVFRRALDVFGVERVLFGTDSSVFPGGWISARRDEQHALLEELGCTPEEQELVFAGNARRVLGL